MGLLNNWGQMTPQNKMGAALGNYQATPPQAPATNVQGFKTQLANGFQSAFNPGVSSMPMPAPTQYTLGKTYDPTSYGQGDSPQMTAALQSLVANNPNLQGLVNTAASKGVVFDNGIFDPYKAQGFKSGDIVPTGNFINGTFGGAYGSGIGEQAGSAILKGLLNNGTVTQNPNGSITSDKNYSLSTTNKPNWTNWSYTTDGTFYGTPTEDVNLMNGNNKVSTIGQVVSKPQGATSSTYANMPLDGWRSLVSQPQGGVATPGTLTGQYGTNKYTSGSAYVPSQQFNAATRLINQKSKGGMGFGTWAGMVATALGAPPGTGTAMGGLDK